jgi:DNA-binding NarL/FixJ family response regulator
MQFDKYVLSCIKPVKESTRRKLRILLADGHHIVREGIRILIEKEPGMEVVAEARNGIEAVVLVAKYLPDIVIIDINFPSFDGVEATRRIVRENPSVRVLALSSQLEMHDAVEILKAGAHGYLTKYCCFEEVAEAVFQIAEGNLYLSPKMNQLVLKQYLGMPKKAQNDKPVLTYREEEILKLMTEGRTTKEIAANLDLSAKTVETHRSNIMEKLNTRCLAGLIKYAIHIGITTPIIVSVLGAAFEAST